MLFNRAVAFISAKGVQSRTIEVVHNQRAEFIRHTKAVVDAGDQ